MQMDDGGNGGTTESQVRAFEADLGVALPVDYRRFLLEHNGGSPIICCFDVPGWGDSLVNEFYGLGFSDYRSIDRAIERRVDVLSTTQTIPIGYDPGGNGIFMGVGPANFGVVYFWDHEEEDGALIQLAPSFEAFIEGLCADE